MNKKMIFFDIDGTLIEVSKNIYRILPEVEEALNQLKANGHDVFLATGRCECFIVDGVSYYPFSGMVTCNGGRVDYHHEPLYRNIVPVKGIVETMKLCSEYEMNYYFENSKHIYIKDKQDPTHIKFAKKWGMKEEICVDDFDPFKIETYIGMIYCEHVEDIPEMKRHLSPYFELQKHRSAHSFDLTLKNTSKALGIEKMVEKLGRSMHDTIAFGDGNNDLEMLKSVGLGIAMGNAVEPCKQAADYITDAIDEHGIVNALKHFELI